MDASPSYESSVNGYYASYHSNNLHHVEPGAYAEPYDHRPTNLGTNCGPLTYPADHVSTGTYIFPSLTDPIGGYWILTSLQIVSCLSISREIQAMTQVSTQLL